MPSESIAFFEGRYMPVKEAKISIVDPAVTKSDIVFDVVSTTGRVFFRLDDHVERFETSCRKMRIQLPVSSDEIKRISGSFPGHYWDVFQNVCRFDEPAGVAGSKLQSTRKHSAETTARTIVCLVADMIAMRERLTF